MPLTVFIGGARSGKSRLAAELVSRQEAPVVVIATAEARDEEMTSRIERHRAERPAAWTTVEEPIELEAALRDLPDTSAVLIDCLTLWTSNAMEHGLTDDEIGERARSTAGVAAARTGSVVVVTNEVGSGVVPPTAVGRRYTDVLGRVNMIWADAADRALLVVAGKVLRLDG